MKQLFPHTRLSHPILAMQLLPLLAACLLHGSSSAQTLQLHYDLRHSIAPAQNPHNFPTLYFEYFKNQDSGQSFIKPGSFLFKTQADLLGYKNNIGKFYLQVSQSFRCWKPKIFLSLQYSGGAGITEPKQYSYYIVNTFSAGLSYPFQWKGAWLSAVLNYKYVPYARPSHDFLYTFYWWKGLLNYKLELAGDFSIWTENNNHGDEPTAGLTGKRFFFFAEPQLWFNLGKSLAIGSKVNLYYHVNIREDRLQAFPTVAIRCRL
jgi:hypothetical protein